MPHYTRGCTYDKNEALRGGAALPAVDTATARLGRSTRLSAGGIASATPRLASSGASSATNVWNSSCDSAVLSCTHRQPAASSSVSRQRAGREKEPRVGRPYARLLLEQTRHPLHVATATRHPHHHGVLVLRMACKVRCAPVDVGGAVARDLHAHGKATLWCHRGRDMA